MQTNLETHGFGPTISKKHGLYHTSQYSLYKIFLSRVLVDKKRTEHPGKAKLFFIPYDFGHDAAIRRDRGIWPNHCRRAKVVAQSLNESAAFKKSEGADHVLIVSINWAMNFYYHDVCIEFLRGVCQKCIKLAIDDYSFLFGGDYESKHPWSEVVRTRGVNWRAVPFPSDVHWSSSMQRPYPWESDHERKYLLAYGGSKDSHDRRVQLLRTNLANQCREYPDVCAHQTYGKGRDFTAIVALNGSTIHDLYNSSVFCLNPPGDLPTRKGLFDSMLLGCIPVTFNPLTARVMYTWHLPEEVWTAILVEISPQEYRKNDFHVVRYMENYVKLHPNAIKEKQKLLRENAFRLQYSLVEDSESLPPGDDAYNVSMQGLFDSLSGRARWTRTGSVPSCGFNCV